jgi:hypothetical protein
MSTNFIHRNRACRLGGLPALAVLTLISMAAGDTGTDPAHKYAWGENVGWANAGPTNHEVTVHYYEGAGGWLSGHAWGENLGWIVMGSAGGGPYDNTTDDNWGVNLAANGELSGYAWGENIGWINFEQTHGQPAINPNTGEFSGHAWGENIGWVSLRGSDPDYGVRTLAFDTQPQGTPNHWLARHGVTEEYDAGDGVPAWRKHVMDVDPTVSGNYLRIVSVSNTDGEVDVVFTPVSTRRYYTLTRTDDLVDGAWSPVPEQSGVIGTGGEQSLIAADADTKSFYSVEVSIDP